ncbi:GlsB/YeaQ/YmgE family stress response membrane protein [Nocardioides sp. GXZ039]|uniref:GlsB/YeaQ/YmgE family stress response membrane protein n=1 Tax=Nocardioides sp. GXZ039 TaxID=3136018 RepID=UPI0030F37CDE
MATILVTIIGGVIVGLLGKLLAPGDKDNIPLWATIVCGILGCVIGTLLYSLFFDPETKGVDWWRHIWQIATAVVLVIIADAVLAKRKVH